MPRNSSGFFICPYVRPGRRVRQHIINHKILRLRRNRGMKKIEILTTCKKLLADIYTPVSVYLRLRDRFRDTILLESADHHAAENSYSFIGINAIAGIEITSPKQIEFKLPGQPP